MSGFKALVLIAFILGNGFLVLIGYNLVMKELTTTMVTIYDPARFDNCQAKPCPNQDPASQELKQSFREVQANYRTVLGVDK